MFRKFMKMGISVFVVSGLIGANQVHAQEQDIGMQFYDIDKIVEQFELLSSSECNQLKALVDGLDPREEGYPTLARISQKIDRKVRKDLLSFEDLFFHVRKFVDSEYVDAIASIREVELSQTENYFERIKENFVEVHPAFPEHGVEASSAQTLEAIQESAALLTGNGASPSIPELWAEVQAILIPVYSKWNRRMAELQKKVDLNQKPDQKRNNILTHDELFFVDTFTKIQAALRRFAPAGSSLF
jgi:hypothetical protein